MSVCGVHHVSGFAQTDTTVGTRAAPFVTSRGARLRRRAGRHVRAHGRAGAESDRRLRPPVARRRDARALADLPPPVRAARRRAAPDRARPQRPAGRHAGGRVDLDSSDESAAKIEAVVRVGHVAPDRRAHRARDRAHRRAARRRRPAGQIAPAGERSPARLRISNAYETTRAIVTGQRVARELSEERAVSTPP